MGSRLATVSADEPLIPLTCPHCQHDAARLTVSSQTILTVTCIHCAYTWAEERDSLPGPLRVAAQIAMLDRDHPEYKH